MKERKPVGIWIRVSTEDQAQGDAPEHHEKRARYYAESKDWNVREVYRLEAVSGKAVIEHPEAKRMLADIKAGHIQGLIFSKLARLARNTRELLDFADRFEEAGAHLISLQEAIDTSTPAGRLFYTIIAAMAQWEREEISSRVAASVPIRAKLGKPLGGAASFGYQWVDGDLVPDPKEAPVRALIYELFLEHRRKKAVARVLNERGYRTRNGSTFSDTTVGRLLDDPTAKGIFRANHTKSLGNGKAWVRKPPEDWVLRTVPAIVSEDVWDRCYAIRLEAERKGKRPTKPAVHLFTGFAFCECGKPMHVPSNSPKYICRACKNKIPVGDLEEVFRSQLVGFLSDPTEVASYLERADETIKEKERLLATLADEKRSVERAKEKVRKAYLADELDVKTFGSEFRPLSGRLDAIESQIPELEAEIDVLRINLRSSDVVLGEARDLYGHWPDLDPAQKRHLIENITERITVGQSDIDIHLSYLPPLATEHVADGQRNVIPALPFCQLRLRATKPKDSAYPATLRTLGDHLRARRLDLGLLQREVADRLGVDAGSVTNWELGRTEPELRYVPRLVAFLGYKPQVATPQTEGEAIISFRRSRGMSQAALAHALGIDPGTLARWERGASRPQGKVLRRVERGQVWLNGLGSALRG